MTTCWKCSIPLEEPADCTENHRSCQYVCSECGETFENTVTTEQALAEAIAEFPQADPNEMRSVCNDCYQILMGPR